MKLAETPALVAATTCQVGENPLWHAEAETLFFLDILAGTIYAYTPAASSCRVFSQGRVTGGMVLQEDSTLLLFQDGRITVLGLDGKQREVASGLCPQNERFNDVVADPEGRVYAGALGGEGRLFRVDTDGRVRELFGGFGIPNGMGFTLDCRHLYFTDSQSGQIHLFDYDRPSGDLTNRRIFAQVPRHDGLPDGMTTDAEGYVWTALWFGSRVRRYAPNGRLDREVFFPVTQTTAVAFGGNDLNDIYVTSAAGTVADGLRPDGYDLRAPRGGGLYRLRVEGLRGRPLFRSRIRYPK